MSHPAANVQKGDLARPSLCQRSFGIEPKEWWVVVALLAAQAGLLGYSATKHSATDLEPAFLVAGISHWQFGRFDLYRVNPPIVRMVAALPVLVVGYKSDWSQYYESPGSRAEFPLGSAFIKANGLGSIRLFILARWACIPFSLIGAYFAYRWAQELYGGTAGLLTLTLYVFEPNLLAHGELITPDGACCAFGVLAGYTFWRWLKVPTWSRAGLAGAALGLAELSKMSWLILFGLWPLLWCLWRLLGYGGVGRGESKGDERSRSPRPPFSQLVSILLLAIYLINAGYAFDGVGAPLKSFSFVSSGLTGLSRSGAVGNRFQGTLAGELLLPFPREYVLGFDSQKKDLEKFSHNSYLRGEVKHGGWWYYYVYGLLVKVPSGITGFFLLVIVTRLLGASRPAHVRDEMVLLLPAIVLLILVSSQLEFNIHLRYVFPSLALTLVFLGQGVSFPRLRTFERLHFPDSSILSGLVQSGLMTFAVLSALFVYPHHLAYFNELAGGPKNGARHMLGSSLDWGQDLLYLRALMVRDKVRVDYRRGDSPAHFLPIIFDQIEPSSTTITVYSPNVYKQQQSIPDAAIMITPACWMDPR